MRAPNCWAYGEEGRKTGKVSKNPCRSKSLSIIFEGRKRRRRAEIQRLSRLRSGKKERENSQLKGRGGFSQGLKAGGDSPISKCINRCGGEENGDKPPVCQFPCKKGESKVGET